MSNLTSIARRLSLCALTCVLGIGIATTVVLLGQPPRAALAVADSSQLVVVPMKSHAPDGLSPTPDWVAIEESPGTGFGHSASTAGDVNGDGYSDVIVGAPDYLTNTGRAYLYMGSPNGLSLTPSFTATGETQASYFGFPVATAGDINGDGYADVLVGAPACSGAGCVYLFLGSASGLDATPTLSLTGEIGGSIFGHSAGTAGDVNGDGYSDVIVGAYGYATYSGRVYVYLGSATGLLPTPVFTATGEASNDFFGWAVGTAGDINGDGYADIAVGATGYGNSAGRVFIYHGTASGINPTPALTLTGITNNDFLGTSLGTSGDVNGDGYSDLILSAGSPRRSLVYLGGATGLSASPVFTKTGEEVTVVGTAGDVNGDGYADIILGAPSAISSTGSITVYLGSASGVLTTSIFTATGETPSEFFGISVGTAGDVNGDGYCDIIIGANNFFIPNAPGRAYVYHGGPDAPMNTPALTFTSAITAGLGRSVSTAGDVNGDGYADVLIGAPNYLSATGQAYLYMGSADGVSPVPAFTATGEAPNNFLGFPVQTAGDVNGDGYDDVIIGASGWPPTPGRVYLYFGSNTGLNATPAMTMTGDPSGDGFGSLVGTAGDVNGDGYGDILISNIYTANVYHGSANGINPTPVFTAHTFASPLIAAGTAGDVNSDGYSDILVSDFTYNSNTGQVHLYLGSNTGLLPQPAFTATGIAQGERFGFSVGAAGDVNGDGYADLVIGAEERENIFLGSVTGPEDTPAFTMTHSIGTLCAVGTAGDVNGDGYADVIVGNTGFIAPGQAFVYLGSAAGPTATPITLTDGITGTHFGESVSTAGDVNGDGYAEVIVGGSAFNGGDGYALLYTGNAAYGLPLLPQQRRADDSAPIAHNGQSDSADSFRLAALGRTPFGRGLVKLVWEVKPFGVSFDGTGLGQSAAWQDTSTAGVDFNELITGLSANTQYHWRVRLRYHPASTPFQQYSRWLTQPWNGWQEADLRTAAPTSTFTLYLPLARR